MLVNGFANKIIDLITSRSETGVTLTGETRVGLSYTDPTKEGTSFTEPDASTGYERVILGVNSSSYTYKMAKAEDSQALNDQVIHFPKALTDYPQDVRYFLIFNGTELCAYGELTTPIKPTAETIPLVERGQLKIAFD